MATVATCRSWAVLGLAVGLLLVTLAGGAGCKRGGTPAPVETVKEGTFTLNAGQALKIEERVDPSEPSADGESSFDYVLTVSVPKGDAVTVRTRAVGTASDGRDYDGSVPELSSATAVKEARLTYRQAKPPRRTVLLVVEVTGAGPGPSDVAVKMTRQFRYFDKKKGTVR